jgi:hypothetical protein
LKKYKIFKACEKIVMTNTQRVIYPIMLHNIYAKLSKTSEYEKFANDKNNDPAFELHKKFIDSDLFISGDRMMIYLHEHEYSMDDYIIFVLNDLRSIYWNEEYASENDDLRFAMKKQYPIPKDIFDDKYVSKFRNNYDYPYYQLEGDVTAYDIIPIKISEFIEHVNRRIRLHVEIHPTAIVDLVYTPYDFWSNKEQKLITYI